MRLEGLSAVEILFSISFYSESIVFGSIIGIGYIGFDGLYKHVAAMLFNIVLLLGPCIPQVLFCGNDFGFPWMFWNKSISIEAP